MTKHKLEKKQKIILESFGTFEKLTKVFIE